VIAEPPGLFLGEVRKGDERIDRVRLRLVGAAGRPTGAVVACPPWMSVSPMRFSRRRQTLSVVAHSDMVWQTGDFQDAIRVATDVGEVQIPVSIRVLPARPRFRQVAAWLVPLFLFALLPAVAVAFLSRQAEARYLVPAGALASGLLAAMLLQVCAAADLGIEERITAGVIAAVMSAVLGVAVGVSYRTGYFQGSMALLGAGAPIGALLACQLFTRRYWKIWSIAIAVLAVLSAGSFATAVSG
jgi:uncharacterized membrane protein